MNQIFDFILPLNGSQIFQIASTASSSTNLGQMFNNLDHGDHSHCLSKSDNSCRAETKLQRASFVAQRARLALAKLLSHMLTSLDEVSKLNYSWGSIYTFDTQRSAFNATKETCQRKRTRAFFYISVDRDCPLFEDCLTFSSYLLLKLFDLFLNICIRAPLPFIVLSAHALLFP